MIGAFIKWSAAYNGTAGYIIDGNGCHVWVGSCDGGGYGQVRVNGRLLKVHRVRYEREVGPIPEGLELDHFVCDNGPGGCCNPHHCRPVTHRENMLRADRGFASKYAAKTHCKRGHLLHQNVRNSKGERVCRPCVRERDKTPEEKAKRTARRQKLRAKRASNAK